MQTSEPQAGSTTGTYVYCVMPTESAPTDSTAYGPAIDDSTRLRLVREDGLTALVSDARRPEYDPSRTNVGAHERVVREAFDHGDVLPMRFGSVARDDGAVASFLTQKHDDLAKALERLHDRAELALKVSWVDRDAILREVLTEDDAIRQLRNEIAAQPGAEVSDRRVELGRRVAEAVEQKRKAEADRIVERLKPRAIDLDMRGLLSEAMIVNAAFLVDRTGIDAFDEAVSALGSEGIGRWSVKYVGPLPPYSFVKLAITKDEG